MSLPEDRESRREIGEELKSNPGFESVDRLIGFLLGDGGCPWDRSRRLADCPEYIKSELDEVIEAIGTDEGTDIEEELGDLLFMVVFTARVAKNEGKITIDGLYRRILEKMVFRHPHIFGGEMDADSAEQVVDNWQKLKMQEKESDT